MNTDRPRGLASIRKRIANAKSLIINDPYILSAPPKAIGTRQYVMELLDILPSSLDSLILIYSKDINPGVWILLKERCPEKIQIQTVQDHNVHDRVWIIDFSSGFTVGTSFNSLGSKISFINPLPVADFQNCLKYFEDLLSRKIQILN